MVSPHAMRSVGCPGLHAYAASPRRRSRLLPTPPPLRHLILVVIVLFLRGVFVFVIREMVVVVIIIRDLLVIQVTTTGPPGHLHAPAAISAWRHGASPCGMSTSIGGVLLTVTGRRQGRRQKILGSSIGEAEQRQGNRHERIVPDEKGIVNGDLGYWTGDPLAFKPEDRTGAAQAGKRGRCAIKS